MRSRPTRRIDRRAGRRRNRSSALRAGSRRSAQFRFRTADGKILWADASQMPGHAVARVNDQGTLTYELGPGQQVTALWLERQETQPSAAVSPRAVGPGEYQRLYGYVQSVGRSTMSFKADDGRILTVDTSQVDAQVRSTVRQGDLVSVVGKTTARADQTVAEVIERRRDGNLTAPASVECGMRTSVTRPGGVIFRTRCGFSSSTSPMSTWIARATAARRVPPGTSTVSNVSGRPGTPGPRTRTSPAPCRCGPPPASAARSLASPAAGGARCARMLRFLARSPAARAGCARRDSHPQL